MGRGFLSPGEVRDLDSWVSSRWDISLVPGGRLNDTGITEHERAMGSERAMAWVVWHGFDRVSEHMAIGMWSASEIYVEDVFIPTVPAHR
jgi:hypothetical protein